MKHKILLFLSLVCTGITSHLTAQINEQDSLALVDLYRSTNGSNWSANGNWLTANPVSSWDGVSVDDNRVTELLLDFNNMKGPLPSSIGNLTAITSVSMAFNKINGSIPASVGNLTQLQYLDLEYNKLTGSIPDSITSLAALQLISLNNNLLTGTLPRKVEKLTNLEYFNVFFNGISGTIPAGFGFIPGLTELYLNNNQLTGIIPVSLGRLTGMFVLDLSNNQLTGTIPPSFKNFTEMFVISLNNNNLTGDVPFIRALSEVNVSNNHLSQSVNLPITGSRDYVDVDLRNNNFNFNGLEYAEVKLPNAEYKKQAQLPVHASANGLAVSAGGTLQNNTYAWVKEGEEKATVIKGDSTFTPTKSGRYFAIIRNAVATQLILTTDTVSFTVPLASQVITASLSPNPVSNLLTVSGLNPKEKYRLMVSDISGYAWINATANEQPYAKIDVNRLKAGSYILNITSENAERKTLMFIKN